tara:strand:- start:63 stop:437 length:375 start_codon:yes stop_codon:yes gene_type:complete
MYNDEPRDGVFDIEDNLNIGIQSSYEIEQAARCSMGIDWFNLSIISYSDEGFIDEIIKKLNLNSQEKPMSFADSDSVKKPDWWNEKIKKNADFTEYYSKTEGESYWSVWVDRSTHTIYLEWGRW